MCKFDHVHFRNIRGGRLNFEETFPDNGSVNMVKAMHTYKEVGYDAMVMPDHVPNLEVPDGQAQAFAFEFGYISALLQAVYNEAQKNAPCGRPEMALRNREGSGIGPR